MMLIATVVQYDEQDDWGNQRVPLCISHQGLFLHNEIDG